MSFLDIVRNACLAFLVVPVFACTNWDELAATNVTSRFSNGSTVTVVLCSGYARVPMSLRLPKGRALVLSGGDASGKWPLLSSVRCSDSSAELAQQPLIRIKTDNETLDNNGGQLVLQNLELSHCAYGAISIGNTTFNPNSLLFSNLEPPTFVVTPRIFLHRVTLRNMGPLGPAIRLGSGTALTLKRCDISNNGGGGVIARWATLRASDSRFRRNAASITSNGAYIFTVDGLPTPEGLRPRAVAGGAMLLLDSSADIVRCEFVLNAARRGGAIFARAHWHSLVQAPLSIDSAAGVGLSGGTITITDSFFVRNAVHRGHAADLFQSDVLDLERDLQRQLYSNNTSLFSALGTFMSQSDDVIVYAVPRPAGECIGQIAPPLGDFGVAVSADGTTGDR
ncbi:MAG: hypothetical protein MHM6MM_007727 [Cercozoa sp. M6MM]